MWDASSRCLDHAQQRLEILSTLLLQGVVGVVTGDQPDALCHAAVRARSASISLACCLDAGRLDVMRALHGQTMALHISQVSILSLCSIATQ